MRHQDHKPLPLHTHTHRRCSYLQSGHALFVGNTAQHQCAPCTGMFAGTVAGALTGAFTALWYTPGPKRQSLQALASALAVACLRAPKNFSMIGGEILQAVRGQDDKPEDGCAAPVVLQNRSTTPLMCCWGGDRWGGTSCCSCSLAIPRVSLTIGGTE